jgi:hypothetical protein
MLALVLAALALAVILSAVWLIGLNRIQRVLKFLAPWVRYAYFLRFSLILWLFAPLMCILNKKDATLTSGILVPEFMAQYLCVGFFLVSAAFASLILARVVLINGPERWDAGYNEDDDARPERLANFLDNDDGKYEVTSLLFAQIPNGLVFLYLIWNSYNQKVDLVDSIGGLAAGLLLAIFFWGLANGFYYLTFVAAPLDAPLPTYKFGKNAARTILFPRRWFRLNPVGAEFPGRCSLEGARTILPRFKVKVGNWFDALHGYGCVEDKDFYLYEAHYFATIVLVAFLVLYAVIWPLAAPVAAPVASWIAILALAALCIFALVVFWTANPDREGSLVRIQLLLTLGVFIFFGAVLWLYFCFDPSRFPIFASVLILVIALSWVLGGMAFFLDRYRVPVLTAIIVAMIMPRMFHLDRTVYWSGSPHLGNSQEEHFLSTEKGAETTVKTPSAILDTRFDPNDEFPLIVVTSTGGGLHASAWTAAILSHLENQFGRQFHRHLLLASTVSGGSVGLLAYLRELHEGTLDSNAGFAYNRMQSAAQCSSLEGVGWGLIYYDLPKAFVPLLPYAVSPSPGDDDLDTGAPGGTALLKDRTWSLRKSFARNLKNRYCDGLWRNDLMHEHPNEPALDPDWDSPGKDSTGAAELTLRHLEPAGADQPFPAFTMNTTSVEDGQRFLLANYDVPELKLDYGPNYRARSFLGTFGSADSHWADLPLVTAAQMSATFPYVSSAARVPMDVDNDVSSVHFVDGGYYDNDGTASAIEFMRYALASPSLPSLPSGEKQGLSAIRAKVAGGRHPVRVLWIEIRNSGDAQCSPAPQKGGQPVCVTIDDPGTGPETPGDHSGGDTPEPWNALSQISGPLLAFWQAGHGSVTARNRIDLGLLEHQLSGLLEVHRVIFADARTVTVTGTDPLNWSLTPAQRREVIESADPDSTLKPQFDDAKEWFDRKPEEWCGKGDSEDKGAECAPPAKPASAKPGRPAKKSH